MVNYLHEYVLMVRVFSLPAVISLLNSDTKLFDPCGLP